MQVIQSKSKPDSEADIVKFEKEWGTLPGEYKTFLKSTGTVSISVIQEGETEFEMEFFSIKTLQQHQKEMLSWLDDVKDAVLDDDHLNVAGIFPIAGPMNDNPNFYLISLEKSNFGKIYLWFHDKCGIFNEAGKSFNIFHKELMARLNDGDYPCL
jgi:hypothetical protein